MRKTIVAVALIIFALNLAFQETTQDDSQNAEGLWKLVKNYSTWTLTDGTSEKMPGQAPHGKYVTIRANRLALDDLHSDRLTMSEGAILVKENYDSINTLESLTVMYRQLPGWLWIVYEPDGNVRRAGRLEDCIACHAGAKRDGVFSWNQP